LYQRLRLIFADDITGRFIAIDELNLGWMIRAATAGAASAACSSHRGYQGWLIYDEQRA